MVLAQKREKQYLWLWVAILSPCATFLQTQVQTNRQYLRSHLCMVKGILVKQCLCNWLVCTKAYGQIMALPNSKWEEYIFGLFNFSINYQSKAWSSSLKPFILRYMFLRHVATKLNFIQPTFGISFILFVLSHLCNLVLARSKQIAFVKHDHTNVKTCWYKFGLVWNWIITCK